MFSIYRVSRQPRAYPGKYAQPKVASAKSVLRAPAKQILAGDVRVGGGGVQRRLRKKKQVLKKLKVALWDSIGFCEREGSMDADIKNETPNDIRGLLKSYPSIEKIAANGGKSAATLKKFFPEIKFTALPSTSPANAAFSLSRLISVYGEFVKREP